MQIWKQNMHWTFDPLYSCMQFWKHLLYKGDNIKSFHIHRKVFDFNSLQWNKSNNIDKPCKIHMFEDIITLAEEKVC